MQLISNDDDVWSVRKNYWTEYEVDGLLRVSVSSNKMFGCWIVGVVYGNVLN